MVLFDDVVVGFFIFKVLAAKSCDYVQTKTSEMLLEVKTIAVHPAYQGKGIGSIIFKEVPAIATAVSVNDCYCVAWKRNGKVAMHNIHINAGFVVDREIENYWKLDSLDKGYVCPACGNPCMCSAVIYHKAVSSPNSYL